MPNMIFDLESIDPSKPRVKHITNPRRLLILSPPSQSLSIIPPLLHSLTGVPVLDLPNQTPEPETKTKTPPTPTPTTPQTDAAPATTTSFAGYTTHSPLSLQTKYYKTDVPVWVDEVPISTDSTNATAEQWHTEFLSAEADIVRDAVGALVVCVQSPRESLTTTEDYAARADVAAVLDLMRQVGSVKARIEEERGGLGDVSSVFVLVGPRKTAVRKTSSGANEGFRSDEDLGDDLDVPLSVSWWEDQLFDIGLLGWEVVEWDPQDRSIEKTKSKFGEYEGMPRIREVLETHEWTGSSDSLLDTEQDSDGEDGIPGFGGSSHSRGFGNEVHELECEMFGLRMAIERGGGDDEEDEDDFTFDDNASFKDDGEDEDIKVESMEGLIMRMQAIRDMGADLPEAERKRFAAKAVQDIMREL
ncbi:Alpha/gamma-adaptin-binding protein p34 [Penicillium taxi]|uniref:Alpha/gamma-adaptin-binding protein p34 n=1 Tax=Penicillium taxi TaxID=168475 RepID=UPI0025452910|nr:Alpha/gamma-adaptin-binding protein p34 [Penicillium taxi]KAJ5899741.1 Alpha/gamma-adaptin-binding protein p34 [Penicillium taxi]